MVNEPSDRAKKIQEGLRKAIQKEMAKHRAAGNKVPVMQNGQIVWIIPPLTEEERKRRETSGPESWTEHPFVG